MVGTLSNQHLLQRQAQVHGGVRRPCEALGAVQEVCACSRRCCCATHLISSAMARNLTL